jgi:hypothetical protein
MANISKFRQTLKDIRVEAVKELVSIMKKHDRKEVETYEFDDTPIVIDSKEVDDTCTLDNIRVVNGTEPYLIFGCSSSYDCEDVTSNDISIDNLIEILDWVLSNEEWLFESEDV